MRWRAGFAFALAAAARLAVAGGESEERVDGPVIGIDLGTTYSCAAVYKSGQVEVIPNEQGGRVTPSVVAFTDDGQLVGEAAKSQADANLARTFFDVKRFIGRNTKQDAAVMKDLAKLPFKLVDRPDGSVVFSVDAKGAEKHYAPEQVTAVLLRTIKDAAEAHLGTKVKSAVITVPSSFNNAQRLATKDAAAVAGLTVLRLLNEPTAAALAYGLDKQASRTVLVYDLGGGTFDVSVLRIENGVFQVLATAGDSHLGGEDFNRKLVDHWLEAVEKKHGSRPSSASDLQRLRQEAEKVKRMLSSTPQARYSIKALEGGAELAGSLTRARFEDLNQDLFQRTIELVKAALKDAGVPKSGVDDVVLVGGSTRIPKVQQLVREFFDNKELTRGLNPDEAVAHGAAIQASALSTWTGGGGGGASAVLLDVTPLTLGIETVGGVMTALISRNSPIPTRNSTTVTTHRDNQPALDVKVFEGERLLTRNNHFLGKFRLGGIPPAPRGQPQVELTFAVDADGILTVTAEDRGTGQNASLTVTSEQGRLSPEQIEAMVKEAEEFLEADLQAKGRADARTALEVYLQSVQGLLEGENQVALPASDRDRARAAVLDGKDWLAANLEAGADEVREKLAEVQSLCGDLGPQHTGEGAHGPSSDDHDMEGHDEL